MTATSAGNSSGCLSAKGLDISLAALKRQDPYINNIMDVASQVALYTYNNRANEWEKTEVEGTLFIYTRLASPRHGFTIMNRLSMENLTEPITKDLDFQLQDPFLLYRNARLIIHGIWFYDKEDCQRIAQRMKNLTQQELVQAQTQGSWPSPAVGGGGGGVGVVVVGAGGGGDSGRGDGDGKAVDIIQMLTKARTEFDKGNSSSEPKEIGGSSVIYGNPNLIKPIPVKPNTQEGEVAEPKPLSLATLFGSQHQHQHQHQHSPKPVTATSLEDLGSAAGKGTRPPVARTLTYDGTLMTSGRSGIPIGGSAALSGNIEGGSRAVSGKEGRNVAGLLPSASTSSPQQQQQQHCPAIQKLMQGQRVGGGALQTLSESPENRLCDNGVPLEHHHHHHPHPNQHHHHHHHHHLQQQQQQQQQFHSDPIKRLFQAQSLLPPSSASFTSPAGPCCPNPAPLPPLQQSPHQPTMVDSCLHLQAQQNQQMCFSLTKPQVEAQTSIQSASTLQGAGLLLSQVTNDQVIQPPQGLSSQMIGVVSPHELLQKLQLVQQEQGLVTNESPRLCPGLAPRFLAPAQSQSPGSVVPPAQNQIPANANQKAGLQFQVISPQRIPATVAPSLLLSPSVFSQAKPSSGLSVVAQENCPAPPLLPTAPQHEEAQILSRSQLQATLLHLIQTDSSFLDTIHKAYISCFTPGSGAKYQ